MPGTDTTVPTSAVPPSTGVSNLVLAGLTLFTAVITGVLLYKGLTDCLEAVSFVTGAICVWLTVRESAWNFPIGLANSATYAVVFFQSRLYSDAGLQIIYLALGVIGWYLWLFGGTNRTTLRISMTPMRRKIGVGLSVAAMLVGFTLINRYFLDSAPVLDALTTAISLGAQWLLDRKNIENWVLWIIVDVIYVPMYAYRHLYLTSLLYAVFVWMAIIGLTAWQQAFRQQQREAVV
jgi:nicotinamide mononucleotide transporter